MIADNSTLCPSERGNDQQDRFEKLLRPRDLLVLPPYHWWLPYHTQQRETSEKGAPKGLSTCQDSLLSMTDENGFLMFAGTIVRGGLSS